MGKIKGSCLILLLIILVPALSFGQANIIRGVVKDSTDLLSLAGVDVPVASFDVMLQGRVPGLYVGTPTGQPGEAGRVTLRSMC